MGTKSLFCKNFGLDPDKTAMLSLGSTFPKENRPIHCALVGSMSKVNASTTLPSLMKVTEQIMKTHASEKGIIHCNSYKLGQDIYDHFRGTPLQNRLIFPRNASERDEAYQAHRTAQKPTVILSPSFTEGFDFVGDLARWQILAKVPYAYLGDKQVAALKDMNPEWYAQKTASTIIQSTGRGVRSETDTCVSYILDLDFKRFYAQYDYMFPQWWKAALIWPGA